ncbi:HNH endonuclease [Corynebacterium striatum]|uniref:HNH endonuclease n=1 Tax=Corynebacterium striatum TaxID=43770 RepID=UPI00191E75C8|nr:HNH endonuclease [Corynebacterium striatum]EGT5592630.1 HNH endonuclease [Corynebacterium striatum]QQU79123.1 HNH endonuclease [Corynebacterium striatum]
MARWSGRQSQRLRALTLQTYGTTCHLCGGPGATTADHLLPRSYGGDNSIENLRPAHASCNSARGNMALDDWFRLHPRVVGRRSAAPSRQW